MNSISIHRRRLTSRSILDAYITMLTGITIVVAYLDLGNYLQIITYGGLQPKYVYFSLATLVAPLLVLRVNVLFNYATTNYALWIMAMVLLNLAHWLVLSAYDNTEAASITLTRLQFLVLSAVLGFVMVQASPIQKGRVFVLVAVILSGLQLLDFFSPGLVVPLGTEGATAGRAGSTLVNANKASESLILVAVLGMAVLRPGWRLMLLLVILPGIFVSFSRAALMVWGMVLALGFWFRLLPRSLLPVYTAVFIVLLTLFGAGLLANVLSYVDLSGFENVLSRIQFFSTMNTGDDSAQERFWVALHAIRIFLDQPLIGNGAAYTYFWNFSNASTHNQHLLMMAEYGLIGYALFVWLLILIFRGGAYFRNFKIDRLNLLAFLVIFAFTPFTHNMFDNLYWLITIALLCQRKMVWNAGSGNAHVRR